MTAIAVQGTGFRHVRKTIAFDGGANNGNLGDSVPVFTLTGRVGVAYMAAYWTTGPTCAAPSVTSISLSPNLIDTTTLDNEGTDIWWVGGDGNSGSSPIDPTRSTASFKAVGISSNVTLDVTDGGGGADVTGGVLEIDFWYFPITDDGALAGDDIDTELVAAIWANATRTLTALGFTLGASDLAAAAITAAKFGAGAINAAAIADGAIDRATFAADTGLQTIRSNTAGDGCCMSRSIRDRLPLSTPTAASRSISVM